MVAPAVMAAGISGGLSLLGGIFGSRSRKKAEQRAAAQRANQFVDLRAAAEKGGFNPLTALMATGGSGFQPQPQGPKLGTGDFIADALSRGADSYFNTIDRKAIEETDNLRREMMREELKDLKRRNTIPKGGYGYSIPKAITSTQSTRNQKPKIAQSTIPQVTGMEKAESAPVENVPLLWQYRTGLDGSQSWGGLNPDAWEVGLGELVAGGIVHGGGYLATKTMEAKNKERKPFGRNIPKKYPRYDPSKNVPPRANYGRMERTGW
jgi:hypothetical protein